MIDNSISVLDFDFLLRAPMPLLTNYLKMLISQRTLSSNEKPTKSETNALRMNPTRET